MSFGTSEVLARCGFQREPTKDMALSLSRESHLLHRAKIIGQSEANKYQLAC